MTTTATPGIDFAAPIKTAKQARSIAEANNVFVARYLVPKQYAWKDLLKSEALLLSEAGLKIVSVYETTASRATGGAAAGKFDGHAAFLEAEEIGQPLGTAIYFAVDFDATERNYDAIENYLRAATIELPGYAVGVYAEYDVIEEMAKRKACTHFWQTYAWSRERKSAHANIYQYRNGQRVAGISCDLNTSYGGEGWWSLSEPHEIDKEAAQKIINILGPLYMAVFPDREQMKAVHYAADALRKASGIPTDQE